MNHLEDSGVCQMAIFKDNKLSREFNQGIGSYNVWISELNKILLSIYNCPWNRSRN